MKHKQLLTRYLLPLLAGLACCLQTAAAIDLTDSIKRDLSNGNTVLVYQMLNQDQSSAQYDDWAYYLNEQEAETTRVYATNADFNHRLTDAGLNTDDSFTLFLKQHKTGYFYDGVIVEALVYIAVNASYQDQPLLPAYKTFMPEAVDICF